MNWIKNSEQLSKTPERQLVLNLIETGLNAIDTEGVIKQSLKLNGQILSIQDQIFDLSLYKRVLVLGFGKASGKAAVALEQILGDKITDGVVNSNSPSACIHIRTFVGSHPLPSMQNVKAAKAMDEIIQNISADDLVICLISGGGSALLCWNEIECAQNTELYNTYLKTGDDIIALNTVRKHISDIKGGWLAKKLYPATVIGLIFSDIAGSNDQMVASGPTFLDTSTVADAQTIIDKYNLGAYKLTETPKEQKYFEKVLNITLVSNQTALQAIKSKAEQQGFNAVVVSAELFDPAKKTLDKLLAKAKPNTVLLGGSEIKLVVDKPGGRGGRNSYLAALALASLQDNDTFAAVASDGTDNTDAAGAIVDKLTKDTIKQKNLDVQEFLDRFDPYSLLEQTGNELIFTGPTEANVSDFLILYRK